MFDITGTATSAQTDGLENTNGSVEFDRDPTRIVQEYTWLVTTIATTTVKSFGSYSILLELDDCVQSGMVGLLDAANKYDPSRGASFRSYASIRIHGSIIDEMRHTAWSTRGIRKNSRLRATAVTKLEQQLLRKPTGVELSEELGLSTSIYHRRVKETSEAQILSLELHCEAHEGANEGVASGDLELHEALDRTNLLALAMSCSKNLDKRLRDIFYQRYINDTPLKEIGEYHSISESRTCQLHAEGIKQIRAHTTSRVLERTNVSFG